MISKIREDIKNRNPFNARIFANAYPNTQRYFKREMQKESDSKRDEIHSDMLKRLQKGSSKNLLIELEEYNVFAREYNLQEINLSDLNIEDIFDYDLHPGLELEQGDLGKCIIYISSNEKAVRFSVSKHPFFTLKDTNKIGINNFLAKNNLDGLVGYHRSIARPEDSFVNG